MNIKETFLKLTNRTYPHGTESKLYHLLPKELENDEFGNKYIKIGESSTMFTSHLDTATSANTEVEHVIDGDIIKTNGKSILGADDKAGVTVMLYMIKNKIPGLYYFFLGEEVGCIGSKKLASKFKTDKIEGIKKVISFDRRGTTSIITHQCSSRCCSDKFGEALAAELNRAGLEDSTNDSIFTYRNDSTGVYTDSAEFTRIYPECTNISVGYQSEHTFNETQNIKHLDKLAKAALLVNWESLPVERDPSVVEYSNYGGYGRYSQNWDDYDYGYVGRHNSSPNSYTKGSQLNKDNKAPTEEKIFFHDQTYNYVSSVTQNILNKTITSTDLAAERIVDEEVLIDDLLILLDIPYDNFTWDGLKLVIDYKSTDDLPFGNSTSVTRNDLSDYIPELNFWKELTGEDDYEPFI